MKKYGIITFYKTHNYGSALQGYALQRTVEQLGYECEIINYQKRKTKKYNIKECAKFFKKVFLASIRRLFWAEYKIKIKMFNSFLKENVKESKSHYSSKELSENEINYQGIICGSDQIWTPTPAGLDTVFLLEFASDQIKKIAYAPSIGTPKINFDKQDVMKKLINRIDFLSIREEHGAMLIKELTGREAKVVLDPTLLVSKTNWEKISLKPNIAEPYILCYFLGKRKEVRNFAKKLREITGYKLVVIPALNRDLFFGDIRKIEVGPKEFVGLIQNAEFVCSDSFHAIIFSINLNIRFFALKRHEDSDIENQNLRVINILNKLHLSDRYVTNDSYNVFDKLEMNFTQSNMLLNELRNESIDYLFNALR